MNGLNKLNQTQASSTIGQKSSFISSSTKLNDKSLSSPLLLPNKSLSIPSYVSTSSSVSVKSTATAVKPAFPNAPLDPRRVAPLLYFQNQRVHSLTEYGKDVIRSMSDWANKDLPRYLRSPKEMWQPSDLLPDPKDPYFLDQVRELRKESAKLSPEYFVVLVGDMITEEALPSYLNMINTLDETRDETGASNTPWARWAREWTAEENRHGDILNKYLYLSGRVDMHSVEITVQRLISNGLDPKLENNPYLCFLYTSFQERATKVCHGSTARLAKDVENPALAKMCGLIASDESRHEMAYQAIVQQFFDRDPDGAMLAFADMMHKGITMPAHLLDDMWHPKNNPGSPGLFHDYSAVANRIGVYTTSDYADIVEYLVKKWKVADVKVESGEAAQAQEYLMQHSARIRKLSNLQMERYRREQLKGKSRKVRFNWIHKEAVTI
nr:plastid acyl-carrier-protein desaturase/stearoyl-ACp-desaturase (STAD) [Polytomella parva]|eukprot:CAMPEP_0175063124 /NCGR_PEP_ID=MMETSP0052_2-20121109/14566_1 /TAXON_ID=51329 ORGANISM="Polytomella parva, Strain SAG 63-3" /NCGR_SAMPLE_ID=MMETSP0052_2 /ASSEMBLY_ACC=CAM_ASM_000194 /LENGTH=438 /DNA_ID=CAMNT_0016329255 /DNA_START=133 /DNA_END=1449 /DNA_ORIENTATION=-